MPKQTEQKLPARSERLKKRKMDIVQKSTINFSQLPTEIILKIMNFVPQFDLIHILPLVSKQFHSLSNDRSVRLTISLDIDAEQITPPPKFLTGRYHQIDSLTLSFKQPEFFDGPLCQVLVDQAFRLTYDTPLPQDYFVNLFQQQVGLKKIKICILAEIGRTIYGDRWPNSQSLETTGQIPPLNILKGISNCKQLENLDLHLKSLSFEELKEIATLHHLKTLIINVTPDVTTVQLHDRLSNADWKKLTRIEICSQAADDSYLNVIAKSCPSLQYANLLYRTSDITRQGITTFLAGCRNLRILFLIYYFLPNMPPLDHKYYNLKLKDWCSYEGSGNLYMFYQFVS